MGASTSSVCSGLNGGRKASTSEISGTSTTSAVWLRMKASKLPMAGSMMSACSQTR